MDTKNYLLGDLKATMKFLKTQDKSIKLASYNTKNKILDYLRSINYDMSQIGIKGPSKAKAEKMFNFMSKGGSYKEPKQKKPQYSLAELKKVMKFLKTQDKSIKLASYNSKKKILDYLQSINYDFSEIPKAESKGGVPRQPKGGVPRQLKAPKKNKSGLKNEPEYYANPFQVLGIPKNTTDETVIRNAYRTLSFKYHPDKHGGNPEYTRMFQLLRGALAVIKQNPGLRYTKKIWLNLISKEA